MLADTSDLAASSIQTEQDPIDEHLHPWCLVSVASRIQLALSSYIGVRFCIVSIYRLVKVSEQVSFGRFQLYDTFLCIMDLVQDDSDSL